MFKKLLVCALLSTVAVGVTAAGGVLPPDGGGIPIEPGCDDACAPAVLLPGGTVCTLAGCVSNGSSVFCLYSCF